MSKQNFSLSPGQKEVFQLQRINLEGPGTILKDFEHLLSFIKGGTVPVTEKHHLFSIKLLPELNAKLSRPLQISLKRPQQKSYPHINALYLLLRATGIARIAGTGRPLKTEGQAISNFTSIVMGLLKKGV